MNFILMLFYSSLVVTVSAKRLRYSDEKSNRRTIPTLKFNFQGSLRQEFAMEALLAHEKENVVCSPVSAMMPLGKLALGIKGRAESELLELLGINLLIEVKAKFQFLVYHLERLPGVKMSMASRLYIPKPDKAGVIRKFQDESLFAFKTSVEELDFNKPDEAAQTINDFVMMQSQHMIDSIISPRDIPKKDAILSVNSVSFESKWRLKFDGTATLPFYSTRLRHTQDVPMMTRNDKYFYTSSDVLNARLIEIQFELNHASMVILLPHSEIGLGYLMRTIKDSPEILNSALKNMTLKQVKVSIPQFNPVESVIDLNYLYEKIGLYHIFNKRSGLTQIVHNKEYRVSMAVQKCYFEISPQNVIAETASGSGKVLMSGTNYKDFTVNKPFLYYILMKNLNEQLFVGIFNNFDDPV